MFLFKQRENEPANTETSPVFLIIGLGNPGREYRFSRHNIGFMVIDELAKSLGTTISRLQFKALMGVGSLDHNKIVLAKPQTYMNLSGQAVRGLVRFYKIPLERIMVIHDDMDLPFGTTRLRPGGGSAGQKGMVSIIEYLTSDNFPRLRVGIDHPPGQMDSADYVLQGFSSFEQKLLPQVLERCVQAVRVFVTAGLDKTMNQFNGSLEKE